MTPPTETYTLSLHDALPICRSSYDTFPTPSGNSVASSFHSVEVASWRSSRNVPAVDAMRHRRRAAPPSPLASSREASRSEEHTSELQSHRDLVCRLLLEKEK